MPTCTWVRCDQAATHVATMLAEPGDHVRLPYCDQHLDVIQKQAAEPRHPGRSPHTIILAVTEIGAAMHKEAA